VDGIDMIGSGRGDLSNALGYGAKEHRRFSHWRENLATAKTGKYISVNLTRRAELFQT